MQYITKRKRLTKAQFDAIFNEFKPFLKYSDDDMGYNQAGHRNTINHVNKEFAHITVFLDTNKTEDTIFRLVVDIDGHDPMNNTVGGNAVLLYSPNFFRKQVVGMAIARANSDAWTISALHDDLYKGMVKEIDESIAKLLDKDNTEDSSHLAQW